MHTEPLLLRYYSTTYLLACLLTSTFKLPPPPPPPPLIATTILAVYSLELFLQVGDMGAAAADGEHFGGKFHALNF